MHLLLLVLTLTVGGFLQAPAPGDSVLTMIVKAAASIIFPSIATWLAMKVSKFSDWVNALQDWEKRVLVVIYGVIINGIAHAMGIALPEALGALGSVEFQTILSTGLAFLLHRFLNPTPAVTAARR